MRKNSCKAACYVGFMVNSGQTEAFTPAVTEIF